MCLFISGPLFPFLPLPPLATMVNDSRCSEETSSVVCVSALEPRPSTSFCPVCLRSAHGSLCAASSLFLTLQGQRGGHRLCPFPSHSSRMCVNFIWNRLVPHLPLMVSASSSQVTACCSLERLSCI